MAGKAFQIGLITGDGMELRLKNALKGQKLQALVMVLCHFIERILIMGWKKSAMVVGQKVGKDGLMAILRGHFCR